uniref:Os01g0772100 protein n=1 Tax=Macrostomum lignano TaxID=282301 RepID=A0A1I8HGP6_9PLAT
AATGASKFLSVDRCLLELDIPLAVEAGAAEAEVEAAAEVSASASARGDEVGQDGGGGGGGAARTKWPAAMGRAFLCGLSFLAEPPIGTADSASRTSCCQ